MSRCIAFQLNTVKLQTGRFRDVAAGFLFYRDECRVPVRCLEEARAGQSGCIPSCLSMTSGILVDLDGESNVNLIQYPSITM